MSKITFKKDNSSEHYSLIIHRAQLARAIKNGVKPFCEIPAENYGNISRNEYYELCGDNRVRKYKTKADLIKEHRFWAYYQPLSV